MDPWLARAAGLRGAAAVPSVVSAEGGASWRCGCGAGVGRRRSGRGARGRVVKGSSARTQTPREENPLREDHTSARRAAPVALVVNATTTALTTAARLADDTKATTTPRAAALITESLTAIGDSDAARAQRTRVLRDDGVRHLPNNLPRQLTIVASLAAAEGGDAAGVGWHAVRR